MKLNNLNFMYACFEHVLFLIFFPSIIDSSTGLLNMFWLTHLQKILSASHDLEKFPLLKAELSMRQPLSFLGDWTHGKLIQGPKISPKLINY